MDAALLLSAVASRRVEAALRLSAAVWRLRYCGVEAAWGRRGGCVEAAWRAAWRRCGCCVAAECSRVEAGEGSVAAECPDQQYTVTRESWDDDDDESEKEKEFNEISCEMDMDKSAPKYFKMSTYLYALAIHDSKAMVNDKIQSHCEKEIRARKQALAIRDKQDQVDARASFDRPQDTIQNLFEKIDKRLAVVEKAAAKTTQQPIQQPSKAENLLDIDDQALTRTILAKIDLLH